MRNSSPKILLIAAAALVCLLSIPSASLYAHGTEKHQDSGVAVDAGDPASAVATPGPLPADLSNIGGPFVLLDHFGQSVTEKTYSGKHMLVFFGYSNCQIMCSISLKRIADALAILQEDPDKPLELFHSLVVTVDPANDTPDQLRQSLAAYHPALTGLTGSLEQLKPVYKAYGQKPQVLEIELNESPIVQHSSYFFLMGPDGKFQTLFPPILNAESMAGIIKKYLPI